MKTYLAHFLAALALALPVRLHAAPKPVRLYEVFAVRITQDNTGFQTIERGLLNSLGGFKVFELAAFPSGVVAPPEALNRTLITAPTWVAYDVLGAEAFANFVITGSIISIGSQGYFPVSASPDARLDLGELVNISTRAMVTPGADPVIGGFVVNEMHRWVLIRAVGPGLAPLGVTNPLPDPYLTLYKHGSNQGLAFNDNWGQRPDAAEIAQKAATVGAFALSPDSKDAAYLVELAPGAYTVHMTTYAGTGGTALLEVYVIP